MDKSKHYKRPIGTTVPKYVLRMAEMNENDVKEHIYKIALDYANAIRLEIGEEIPDIRVTQKYSVRNNPEKLQEIADAIGAYQVEDVNWSRFFADALLVHAIKIERN